MAAVQQRVQRAHKKSKASAVPEIVVASNGNPPLSPVTNSSLQSSGSNNERSTATDVALALLQLSSEASAISTEGSINRKQRNIASVSGVKEI